MSKDYGYAIRLKLAVALFVLTHFHTSNHLQFMARDSRVCLRHLTTKGVFPIWLCIALHCSSSDIETLTMFLFHEKR